MSDLASDRQSVGGLVQVPVLILAVAFFALCVVQTVQLVSDRETLATAKSSQETPIQEGTRVRQQLDSLFSKTTALANEGNAGAKAVLEELRRQGVVGTPRQ
jgi:uncharacterized protein YoxC